MFVNQGLSEIIGIILKNKMIIILVDSKVVRQRQEVVMRLTASKARITGAERAKFIGGRNIREQHRSFFRIEKVSWSFSEYLFITSSQMFNTLDKTTWHKKDNFWKLFETKRQSYYNFSKIQWVFHNFDAILWIKKFNWKILSKNILCAEWMIFFT